MVACINFGPSFLFSGVPLLAGGDCKLVTLSPQEKKCCHPNKRIDGATMNAVFCLSIEHMVGTCKEKFPDSKEF